MFGITSSDSSSHAKSLTYTHTLTINDLTFLLCVEIGISTGLIGVKNLRLRELE